MDNAEKYYGLINDRRAPTVVVAHSRGGPIALNMLKMLQDKEKDGNIVAVVLVSPISSGVRSEIHNVIKFLPIKVFRDMCNGESGTIGWKSLNVENRAKVVVINSVNGGQFTSIERGYVEGGTFVVTKSHDGHIQQCVDSKCDTFRAVSSIVNGVINRVDDVCVMSELRK